MEKKNNYSNLYDRRSQTYHNASIIIKVFLINLLISIIMFWISEEWYYDIFILEFLFIYAIVFELAFVFVRYQEGYRINKEGITYQKFFLRKKIAFNEINTIVISYAKTSYRPRYLGRYRKKDNNKKEFVPYPWITLCSSVPEKINKSYNIDLTSRNIDYMLKKECLIYSFRWNKRDGLMDEMFSKFEGNYYITNSLYTTYKEDVKKYMRKYSISWERVVIIPDKEKCKF